MRRRRLISILVVILLLLCIGWLIQSNTSNKQTITAAAPTQSPTATVEPSTMYTPESEQSSAAPSASPSPTKIEPSPTKSAPTPKVQATPSASSKPTVKRSASPASTSRYPRMRGDVVPTNYTNTPYTAGKDIPIGLYHSTGTDCGYQIRTVNKTLINVSIYEKGSTLAELKDGEQLLNSECGVTFGPPTFQEVLLPGAHLVGVDIEPGIYHAANNLSCRFALTTRALITRGNETIKVGFGNLNGVRDMLIPADAEAVFFDSECGVLTKVG